MRLSWRGGNSWNENNSLVDAIREAVDFSDQGGTSRPLGTHRIRVAIMHNIPPAMNIIVFVFA